MPHPPLMLNDGTQAHAALRVYLNLANLINLRDDSAGPAIDAADRDRRLAADGFEGVQLADNTPPIAGSSLPYCGLDRVNLPAEADAIAARHAARGDECLTVHVGWGTEDDDEVDRLVEAVLTAAGKHRLPTFIETHRATITQDLWRTVRITRKFPEVRFNADFSHYYCGQEMVYGDWDAKMQFMAPIFERTGFMHGRIASPGCMQVPVDPRENGRPLQAHGAADYLAHFKDLWTRAMAGFCRNAGPGDVLIFAPELLSAYYARQFPDAHGKLREESDRYAEAIAYARIAHDCFAAAVAEPLTSRETV
ncbi:MAG: hypothetical protein QM754_06630 [Tepidisphaeraceae bacterium]